MKQYDFNWGFILEPKDITDGKTAVEALEFALGLCQRLMPDRKLKRLTVEFVPIKRDDDDDADD